MSPVLATVLLRHIRAERPDLSADGHAALMTRIAADGGAGVDRDARLRLSDAAKTLIADGKPAPAAPAPTPRNTPPGLAEDLAAARSPVERARIRERYARQILGDRYRPTKENP